MEAVTVTRQDVHRDEPKAPGFGLARKGRLLLTACSALWVLIGAPWVIRAQSAENVAVVINEASDASVRVGESYIKKRAIPDSNVIRIRTPTAETIERDVYQNTIESPIAAALTRGALQRSHSLYRPHQGHSASRQRQQRSEWIAGQRRFRTHTPLFATGRTAGSCRRSCRESIFSRRENDPRGRPVQSPGATNLSCHKARRVRRGRRVCAHRPSAGAGVRGCHRPGPKGGHQRWEPRRMARRRRPASAGSRTLRTSRPRHFNQCSAAHQASDGICLVGIERRPQRETKIRHGLRRGRDRRDVREHRCPNV